MRTNSNRELARQIGVSETAVRRAEKAGRIQREADGAWDLAKVKAAWSGNTDRAQQRRPHRAVKPVPQAAVGAVRETLREHGEPTASGGAMTFMQARTANEVRRACVIPRSWPEYRDARCKASTETVCEALVGNYRPEHVFALQQALDLYDAYQVQVAGCDERIEEVLRQLCAETPPPEAPLPPPRHRSRPSNALRFDVRAALHAMLALDLTQIHGLGPQVALKLVGECGTDMSRWPSAKHFTSWLGLAPGSKISGGKILSAKTRRCSSRAAAALRLSAVTVGRTDSALGGFYRRVAARLSPLDYERRTKAETRITSP